MSIYKSYGQRNSSAKDLEHIFEPFYSKKEMGRSGTGLGLAIVWNTMEDHNGYVFVDSDSSGTTFSLYFPVIQGDNDEVDIAQSDGTHKGGSVLVVDDVDSIRIIAKDILEMLGYDVYVAESGEEAIEFLKTHRVDVMILDMIMEPGMNGYETYKKVLEIVPNQKAIITSGYSETDDMRKTLALGATCYIKKPYTVESLSDAIKKALLE